jgi:hypothetical protein
MNSDMTSSWMLLDVGVSQEKSFLQNVQKASNFH